MVFVDGECVLCNRLATWLERHDPDRRFRIAALQGESARRLLGPPEPDPSEWVVVLLDEDGTHERSEAILRIARGLGGAWRFAETMARLVPRAARDLVYDAVARRRYRWFGREDECRLPRPDVDGRFLP